MRQMTSSSFPLLLQTTTSRRRPEFLSRWPSNFGTGSLVSFIICAKINKRMWRRRLVFTIPKDVETHYSEIKGEYIGKIWNPLYHAYSYYLPAESSHENVRKSDNDELTGKSIRNLKVAMASMILLSPMGTNAMLINVLGSVLWAESESIFAKWDGHVSFGSSHLMAHTWGFGIAAILKTTPHPIPVFFLRIKANGTN